MEARLARWLSAAVVMMLVAALLGGIFLPVYTDEIGWRFQERAGFDGVDKLFADTCGPNTLAVPPWFMMPIRWYSALFNGAFADPFWIRVSGVLYALVAIGLVLVLIRRLTADAHQRALATIIGLGLLALGTMPLAMVWSRPEQPIALAAIAALVLALADGPARPLPSSSSRQAWLRSLGIWMLCCVAVSYHVKGLFVLPLMLGCLFFASRGAKSVAPRVAVLVLTLVTTAAATSYWGSRMACPGDAILRQASSDNNLSGTIAHLSSLAEARQVVGLMFENIGIFGYVREIGPQAGPMSSWLEAGQIGTSAAFGWFLALCLAWTLALALGMVSAGAALLSCWRERRLDPRPVLAILAGGVAMAWASMQMFRNVYETKFVLVLLALAIVLGLAAAAPAWLRAARTLIAAGIGLFALASPVAIAALYAPSLERATREQGYLAAQPFSIGVFGFDQLRPQILAAAQLCGIRGDRPHALMVDDVTYLPFIHGHLPQHAFGVIGGWKGQISDPLAYLRSRRSDGAVVSCRFLDPDLSSRALRVGEICCLPRPGA